MDPAWHLVKGNVFALQPAGMTIFALEPNSLEVSLQNFKSRPRNNDINKIEVICWSNSPTKGVALCFLSCLCGETNSFECRDFFYRYGMPLAK